MPGWTSIHRSSTAAAASIVRPACPLATPSETPARARRFSRHRAGDEPEGVDRAVALIEALACPSDPGPYEDRYAKRLRKIVQRKRKGQTVEAPEREKAPSPVPDLMAALEDSLAEVKRGNGRTAVRA